jgi:hypothetical protein
MTSLSGSARPQQIVFGAWPSPISVELIAKASAKASDPKLVGEQIWWAESRPQEGGRVTLMRKAGVAGLSEVVPAPFSVRTRVHEYGGAAWWLGGDQVFFSNDSDSRVYSINMDSLEITPATSEDSSSRFADGANHPDRSFMVAVRERMLPDEAEAKNEIVAIADGNVTTLVASNFTKRSVAKLDRMGSR